MSEAKDEPKPGEPGYLRWRAEHETPSPKAAHCLICGYSHPEPNQPTPCTPHLQEAVRTLEAEVADLRAYHHRASDADFQLELREKAEARAEAAEARLAEAVRLLGSLFSVFGHSGLEPKYPALTRQVSDFLASIDNDPAKTPSGVSPSPTDATKDSFHEPDLPRSIDGMSVGTVVRLLHERHAQGPQVVGKQGIADSRTSVDRLSPAMDIPIADRKPTRRRQSHHHQARSTERDAYGSGNVNGKDRANAYQCFWCGKIDEDPTPHDHLSEIEAALEEGVRNGMLEKFTKPSGETAYRLTEQGDRYARVMMFLGGSPV